MEKIKQQEGEELIEKKKRWRPRKEKTNEELLQNLQAKEAPIPDWKNFDIHKIAGFNPVSWALILKNVKEDKEGNHFIVITWRKYVEFKNQQEIPDSFYQMKWKTLFVWDKLEWTTLWDGVSYRSSMEWINIHLEERRTKYKSNDWALYLWKLYKNTVYSTSKVLIEITRNWKKVKITEDMVERYLLWQASSTEEWNISYAKRTNPEFSKYMEDFLMNGWK